MKKYILTTQINLDDSSMLNQVKNVAAAFRNILGLEAHISMIEPSFGDKFCYWFYWCFRSAGFIILLIPLMIIVGFLQGLDNAIHYVKNLTQWDDTPEDPNV